MITIPPSGMEQQFAKDAIRDIGASVQALADARDGRDPEYYPSLVTADTKATAGLDNIGWLRKIALFERGATGAAEDSQRAVFIIRGLRRSAGGLTPDSRTRISSAIDLLDGATRVLRTGYRIS